MIRRGSGSWRLNTTDFFGVFVVSRLAACFNGRPAPTVVDDPWVYGNNNVWDASWNRRPYPSAGACFFKNAGYDGDRFCIRRGDRLDRLPGNFGDNISSIKLMGNSRVVVFNDRDFRGGSQQFKTSVEDLRNRRFADGHTWNNRISSIVVH
jgi:hypothetical protein